jgi:LCP family protein required for cell wall assembly
MTQSTPSTETRPSSPKWLRIALWAAFIVAAALVAYLTFVFVRDITATWEMTNLPGVTIKDATPTPGPDGQAPESDAPVSLQPQGGPTPEPWDGANRVSMLIMGLDYRDWKVSEGPPRTDTMILLTIDPVNRTAGMISIPRDLWVNIPGFEYGRINSAYQLGEASNYPGGGPALAAATVEQLLGVPVEYYAQIDFIAFVRFIDELGGVTVDVPEKIKVDPRGPNNTTRLKPGRQVLPGNLALAYARARKTEGGDFDRAQRQQQVIMGIRHRLLKFDNLMPTLVAKAPALYEELSSGVNTNLSLDDAIRLGWLALQIPEEDIKRAIIGADHVAFAQSPDGEQDVLKPLTEKIRLLRDEIFTESGPVSPMAADMEPAEQVAAEGARVAVLNGSYTPGLAASTAEYLRSLGVNVTRVDNSDRYVSYTEITFYIGKPYTVKALVELMNVSQFRVRHVFDPTSEADIVIILGDDWAQNNPMP